MLRYSRVRLEWFVKAGGVLLAVLLVLMTINSLKLLSMTRSYLEDELDARLMNLKEILSPEIDGRFDLASKNPEYLRSLALNESLKRIRLIDFRSRTVLDSQGNSPDDRPAPPAGITEEKMKEVWGGLTVVSPVYDTGGGLVRSVYFPVHDSYGRLSAVCEITLDAGHIQDLTELGTTHFVMKSALIGFIIIGLLYMLRTLLVSQKKIVQAASGVNLGTERKGSGDDVSFVINSFQTVVSELKEKERELRALKDRAEERARLIESYNENVLKSVQSGVVTFDVDGIVKTLNPAAREMLGLDEGNAVGKDSCKVFGEGSWLCDILGATLREGRVRKRDEGGFVTPGGAKRWFGAGTSPLVDGEGTLMGAILVFTDLSEVKQLRDKIELKERMTLLGEMSTGIAHELRNPMAVISGYARLLAKRLGDDHEALEAVESMQEEIAGMDDIIREFMNFARPTDLNLAEIELGQVLEEAARAACSAYTDSGTKIELEEGLPAVSGDQVLLKQAFINIINNGLEAMDDAGTVSIKAGLTGPDEAKDNAAEADGFIRIDFTDAGRGIPEDDMKKIFTPFYTTKGRGTGLGLAIVQKILVHHGGRVEVKSGEGMGTTFSVFLPAIKQKEPVDG